MRIARVWADDDGVTHFDEVEIPLADAGEIGRLSETFPAVGVVFRENDPDYDFDWHPAPRRQLVVLLDGSIEIEVGDGEVRRFAGGDVVLLEDTGGRGHRTRNVEPTARRSLFVALGPEAIGRRG
ncbi:MAG TPA: hypothetical protein VM778_04625 [Gemmatimonadota bacterium]|nr:hypothetical protein [Gemmatimonadota bacterium]